MSPALSHAVHLGLVAPVAIEQESAFHAGILLARTEGIVPAPESTHALAAAFSRTQGSDRDEVIVIGVSGHGQLDLPAYPSFIQSYPASPLSDLRS